MKENNNAFAYISIVAIVAIVAVFVMFAGSGSKETSQPIVLDSGIGGDLVGDARLQTSGRSINGMISGKVYDTEDNPIPGVKIKRVGDNTHLATTNNNGDYTYHFSGTFSGEIYAEKDGWSFVPSYPNFYEFNQATGENPGRNFLGCSLEGGCKPGLVKISGVVTFNGEPIQGISLRKSDQNGNQLTITNTNGYYEFIVPAGWSGTITPVDHICVTSYSPGHRSYSNVWQDKLNQNYAISRTIAEQGTIYISWSEEDAQQSLDEQGIAYPNGFSYHETIYDCFTRDLQFSRETRMDNSRGNWQTQTISTAERKYEGDLLNINVFRNEENTPCWYIVPPTSKTQVYSSDYYFTAKYDCNYDEDGAEGGYYIWEKVCEWEQGDLEYSCLYYPSCNNNVHEGMLCDPQSWPEHSCSKCYHQGLQVDCFDNHDSMENYECVPGEPLWVK